MEARLSFVTLGVTNLARATRFYEVVLGLPRLESPPSIAFFELGKTWLALYPRDQLAADATVSSEGSGFSGFTLSHNVGSPAGVDQVLAEVAAGGGRIVKPAQRAVAGPRPSNPPKSPSYKVHGLEIAAAFEFTPLFGCTDVGFTAPDATRIRSRRSTDRRETGHRLR